MPIVRTPMQNKEKKLKYYAKLATDIDRSLEYYYNAARKGAARRGIPFHLTVEDIRALWEEQQGRCALSGIEMSLVHGTIAEPNPLRISVDRIDSSIGYYKSNVQLITWQLNAAKSVWTNQQLIETCRAVAKFNA